MASCIPPHLLSVIIYEGDNDSEDDDIYVHESHKLHATPSGDVRISMIVAMTMTMNLTSRMPPHLVG